MVSVDFYDGSKADYVFVDEQGASAAADATCTNGVSDNSSSNEDGS